MMDESKVITYQCSDAFLRGIKRIGKALAKGGTKVDPENPIAVIDVILYREALFAHGFKLAARVKTRGGKRAGAGRPASDE